MQSTFYLKYLDFSFLGSVLGSHHFSYFLKILNKSKFHYFEVIQWILPCSPWLWRKIATNKLVLNRLKQNELTPYEFGDSLHILRSLVFWSKSGWLLNQHTEAIRRGVLQNNDSIVEKCLCSQSCRKEMRKISGGLSSSFDSIIYSLLCSK